MRGKRRVRAFGTALAMDGANVLGLTALAVLHRADPSARAIRRGNAVVALVGWLPAVAAFSGYVRTTGRRRGPTARLVVAGAVITVGGAAVLAIASPQRRTTAESLYLLLGGAVISGVYLRIVSDTGGRPAAPSSWRPRRCAAPAGRAVRR